MVGLTAAIWSSSILRDELNREVDNRILSHARGLARVGLQQVVRGDVIAALNSLGRLKSEDQDIAYIYIVDFDNDIFAHTFKDGFPTGLAELDLSAKSDSETHSLDFKSSVGLIQHLSYPLVAGTDGRLHIGINRSAIEAKIDRTQLQILGITAVVVTLGILTGFFVSRRITEPLSQLAEVAGAYGRDEHIDLNTLNGSGGVTEVATLSETFKNMIRLRDSAEAGRRQSEQEVRRLNAELEERVKRRTAELEAANAEMEAFTYSVSHDLRAPLRSLDGFSRILLEDCGDQVAGQAKHYLTRIRSGTKRMGDLIDDLLKLSRSTRGELQIEETDLSAIAQAVAGRLCEGDEGRAVEFRIQPGLKAVADPRFMAVILENLLGNAFKYTAKTPQPRVEFGCETRDGKTTYRVADNGAGFDMAYANKLFAPFQRLHRSSEFEGNGVGLATVNRIILRHGGTVRGEGEVDKGAVFYFTL